MFKNALLAFPMTTFVLLRTALNAVHVSSLPLQRACALSLSVTEDHQHWIANRICGLEASTELDVVYDK